MVKTFLVLTGLHTNRFQQMRRHFGQSIPRCHRWTLCCQVSGE